MKKLGFPAGYLEKKLILPGRAFFPLQFSMPLPTLRRSISLGPMLVLRAPAN